MTEGSAVVFSERWTDEHQNILRARRQQAAAGWELGVRLNHLKANQGWLEIEAEGAPFATWTDYLERGVDLGLETAYKYMDAARFPKGCTDEVGIEKMALLRKVTDLTALEETPEEAMALHLPVGEGEETAPFGDLTVKEVEAALRLMRERNAPVKNLPRRPRPGQQAADELRAKVVSAVHEWMTPEQIHVRAQGKEVLVDLRRVKGAEAGHVFSALAQAMK